MKKFLAVIFSAIILTVSASTLVGCGCSNADTANEPATEIVGNWGGRSDDVEAEFNDDGTCVIGGVTGTYEVDENNTLTVTPNSNGEAEPESMVFEYYNNDDTSAIQPNQWTVNGDTLFINGHQYNSTSTGNSSLPNTQNNANDAENNSADNNTASSKTESSSKPANNSSSSDSSSSAGESTSSGSTNTQNSSSSSDSQNSQNSSSSSNTSDSQNSSTTVDNSSSSSSEVLAEGEEGQVVTIVEVLDDF